MLSNTLKRWLILGGGLVFTLYLAWNAPPDSGGIKIVQSGRSSNILSTVTDHSISSNGNDSIFKLEPRQPVGEKNSVVDIFGLIEAVEPEKQIIIEPKPLSLNRVPPLPFSCIPCRFSITGYAGIRFTINT